MTELEFILVTIVIVIFITAVVNKILTKSNKQKQIIPKDEKFDENLNNLDKIIEGVAVKEKNDDEINSENNENNDDENFDEMKKNTQNNDNKKNSSSKKNSKFDLKKSIIAKEIIDKKH